MLLKIAPKIMGKISYLLIIERGVVGIDMLNPHKSVDIIPNKAAKECALKSVDDFISLFEKLDKKYPELSLQLNKLWMLREAILKYKF